MTFEDASMPIEIENTFDGTDSDVSWMENGYKLRVHFDYYLDSASWTIATLRVYRIDDSDWIRVRGPLYTTPQNQAYDGDMHFDIDENGHQATLDLTDAHLAPFGFQ
jgi:hypothetical protein